LPGLFCFPLSITKPITSFGDDISSSSTVSYRQINRDKTMIDKPPPNVQRYEIRLKGHLDTRWGNQFEGMTITLKEDGTTVLSGTVPDQPALYGLLRKVRDLGLTLVAVNRVTDDLNPPGQTKKGVIQK
jgi:hypothetical protein